MKGFLIAVISVCFFACSSNNVKTDDSLEKYFTENNVSGCFALLDNGTGEFTVYNLTRYRDSAYLPASTFKIVNSLIGETMPPSVWLPGRPYCCVRNENVVPCRGERHQ